MSHEIGSSGIPVGLTDFGGYTTDDRFASTPSNPSNASNSPSQYRIETGTTTVALTAADGVVLAADRRASVGGGRFVSNKETVKVETIHPTAALTLAGGVGDLQSYVRTIRAEASLYERRRGEPMSISALATLAGNLLRGGPFFAAHPTLAGIDDSGPQVYDLDGGGAVLPAPYVASGSGMQLAFGVLEREFDPEASVEEARDVAAQAIDSASERDTASGNGITLATVTAEGVETEEFADPMEVV